MNLILFISVFILYSIYSYISCNASITAYYFIKGLIIALLGNLCWLIIAKLNPQNILRNGIIFDTIVTCCFIYVPMVLGRYEANKGFIFGLILVIIGLITMKIS